MNNSHQQIPCVHGSEHEWVVYSTSLTTVSLMLQCVACGALATVDDPTKDEWSQAFYAPKSPYRWLDESRVVVQATGTTKFYVVRRQSGADCAPDCPHRIPDRHGGGG